jgi:hypothetical protein
VIHTHHHTHYDGGYLGGGFGGHNWGQHQQQDVGQEGNVEEEAKTIEPPPSSSGEADVLEALLFMRRPSTSSIDSGGSTSPIHPEVISSTVGPNFVALTRERFNAPPPIVTSMKEEVIFDEDVENLVASLQSLSPKDGGGKPEASPSLLLGIARMRSPLSQSASSNSSGNTSPSSGGGSFGIKSPMGKRIKVGSTPRTLRVE